MAQGVILRIIIAYDNLQGGLVEAAKALKALYGILPAVPVNQKDGTAIH
jgi:hypothetical protein